MPGSTRPAWFTHTKVAPGASFHRGVPECAAGILPAEGTHPQFVSRSHWAHSNCRQDAGSTFSCHDETRRPVAPSSSEKASLAPGRSYGSAVLYFDHNATTPMLPEARQVWLEATEKFIGNPSSSHRLGQRADAALQAAREELAACLGCDAMHIVWTSGATESANAVFHHLAQTLPSGSPIWLSAIEHPCVIAAATARFPGRVALMPVNHAGVVEAGWLRDRLRLEKPGAVALMAANNETGVLQPWSEVSELCREAAVTFFCDAVQWAGKLPARGLGSCDFVSGSAHKFGGPRGVGFLKCPPGMRIKPLLVGGGQEDGRRAGTENVAGVLSMVAALGIREKAMLGSGTPGRESWRREFEARLVAELPGCEIVGGMSPRLWNTVSALMPEADCQRRWVVKLDRFGFAVSTGSACSSGHEEPSHVLAAMGCTSTQAARVLRFSSGWETPREDWASLLAGLKQVNALVGSAVVQPTVS